MVNLHPAKISLTQRCVMVIAIASFGRRIYFSGCRVSQDPRLGLVSSAPFSVPVPRRRLFSNRRRMLHLVEDSNKSVLCVGYISRDKYDAMKSSPDRWHAYRQRLRSLFRDLTREGFNTYLYPSWGLFDLVSAGVLRDTKAELLRDFDGRYVYSMGVFECSRPMLTTPPCPDYLDDILLPQCDDVRLTRNIVFRDLLSNVSTVMYDNAEGDPFIQSVLDHARQRGKRLLDI